jgi:hypothetical protein
MNIQEYKKNTLARADVRDIVKLEAVERDRTGQVIVTRTEGGKDLIKYDVHLMREVDGVVVFDKEMIAVLNKGKEDEEVQFRSPTTEPKPAVAPSQIESYVKSLPFINPVIEEMNTEVPYVYFRAVQALPEANKGREVRVFAYKKGTTPTYLILE